MYMYIFVVYFNLVYLSKIYTVDLGKGKITQRPSKVSSLQLSRKHDICINHLKNTVSG